MDRAKRIRCREIPYRQGFIEVLPGIHDGCINIETWQTGPDIAISNIDVSDDDFPEDGITANTELELSLENAEQLVNLLQSAINKIKSRDIT